jgi:hypothetical protein
LGSGIAATSDAHACTPRAVPVVGLVELELSLPGKRPLDCTARVVRVVEREQDYELGVKLIHAEDPDLNRHRTLVTTLRKEASGKGRGGGTTVRLTRRRRRKA